MADSLRIVWVKIGGLWPPNMGGRLRSFHIVSELARRHRVSVLTTHGPSDDPEGLARELTHCEDVVSVPYAIPKAGSVDFAVALGRSWFSPYPADLWKCQVPGLQARLRETLASGVDLCVADFLVAMPNVPRLSRPPTILFEHNVEYMIWKRLCEVEGRGWRRALLTLEWRKMRRYERRACKQARLTVAVSEADRLLLSREAPEADIRAMATGVDTSYFQPGGNEKPGTMVFTGAMDWYPNEDAVIDFTERILPLVRGAVPEASLTVVGRNPSERLKQIAARAGVRITGTVPDIRPHVANAAVCVVPLRVGGGTRLKIFEALAMGKAVVSTTIGAEGLPIKPGEHFLQADTPGEFADAVIGLLRDSGRRRAFGTVGRRLVEERYSWGQVARQFEGYCEEVVVEHAG